MQCVVCHKPTPVIKGQGVQKRRVTCSEECLQIRRKQNAQKISVRFGNKPHSTGKKSNEEYQKLLKEFRTK